MFNLLSAYERNLNRVDVCFMWIRAFEDWLKHIVSISLLLIDDL